jgi:hypothetical protein
MTDLSANGFFKATRIEDGDSGKAGRLTLSISY